MALNKANNIPNDGIANPFINLNGNVTSLGGVRNTPNRGATSARPTTPVIGDQYFDTTTNVLQVFTTNGWVAAATKPDAPTNVVAVSAYVPYGGLPGVKVTWNTATTAVPASYYVITSNTGGFTATTTEREATFLGLTAGTSYTFTVAATNNYGSSSATSNAITPVTAPQAITLGAPTASGEGLSVPVTPGATGGSAITGYTLYAQPGNIAVTSATSPVVFKTNVPITGGPIAIGTRYSFSGIANNVAGPSALSNTSASEMNKTTFVTTGLTADYDFYRGSYAGQNWIKYSEDVSQSSVWNTSSYGAAVTSTSDVNPFGGTTGVQRILGGATNPTLFFQQVDASAAGTGAQVISVYAKYYNAGYFTLNTYWDSDGEINISYAVDGTMQVSGDPTGTATITDVGNGWYLCQFTLPARVAGSGNIQYRVWPSGRGLTTIGCYFYGFQVKNATSAKGYIKTTSSALNYATGSTIYDLSGNGNNWTCSNIGYNGTAGVYGNGSLVFNGTNTGGPLPSFGTSISNYTMSFWSNRFADAKMLIGGSAGYQFGDNSWAGSSGEWYYPRTAANNINVWGHTVIAVASNNIYNIYHNGYFEGSLTLSGNTPANFSGVYLGTGYGGYIWSGALGRFSLYINKTLTAAEVLQNYNADRQRYGV